MVSEKKLANAIGGNTARACDSCIRKRARWFCAADDAFLCQSCDASVHSANPLARRHERVRLQTASIKSSSENSIPSWHHGFTRKARTPRHGKHRQVKSEEVTRDPLHLVPEIGADENSHDEKEEQLLYRVPVFDPFAAELCISAASIDSEAVVRKNDQSKAMMNNCAVNDINNSNIHGFYSSDMDLAEFAADVESLLGKGFDASSFDMEGLGLLDCKEKESMEGSFGSGRVKLEEEDEEEGQMEVTIGHQIYTEIDLTRETFELNFDYDSNVNYEEEDKAGIFEESSLKEREEYDMENAKKKKKILLALDYDGVIALWADQRSPWITGDRPELDPNGCWPDCMGNCGRTVDYQCGAAGDMMSLMMGVHYNTMLDGGREARVSRYREKRRTRLFSKKIRYEVRKLNAEKRPRMKGRFVKRANSAGHPSVSFA